MKITIIDWHSPKDVLFEGEISTLEEYIALGEQYGNLGIQQIMRHKPTKQDRNAGEPGLRFWASKCCFFKQH